MMMRAVREDRRAGIHSSQAPLNARFSMSSENGLTLPPLPYKEDALDPVISANTIGFHYGKHHKTYVDNVNKMASPEEKSLPLTELVRKIAGVPEKVGLFNNAAQVWNHNFYWKSLAPKAGGKPTGKLKDKVDADFGSYDELRKQLKEAAVTQFGSGWAWLIVEGGKLKVVKTSNADTPIAKAGQHPLVTIDVWEHAYYLDYQNRRADHVDAVLDRLINWSFAEENLAQAR